MVISPPIQVATIGMDDTLLLMILALVLLGPRRLPQVGRQIGKLMYEFRKASNDFKYQLEEELRNAEEADRWKREEAERQRALAEAQTAVAQAQSAAEQALQAAAQAQNAAQAAQSAAETQAALPAPEATETDPEDPDMIYNYGYEDSVYDQKTGYDQAAAEYTESSSTLTPSTEPVPAAEAAETGLRVQPPSTGEQVAASRPGRPTEPIEPEEAPEDSSLKKEVAAEVTPPAAESTAHHG